MDGSGWKSAAAEREDGWLAADLVLVLTGCSRGERLRERWGRARQEDVVFWRCSSFFAFSAPDRRSEMVEIHGLFTFLS